MTRDEQQQTKETEMTKTQRNTIIRAIANCDRQLNTEVNGANHPAAIKCILEQREFWANQLTSK